MVLLAGCGGGVGGDATTATDSSAGATDATATAADGDSADQSGDGDATERTSFDFNGTWDQRYRTGQYYRYDITSPSIDGTATYEWEVVSATDDEVTIRTKLVTPNTTSEQTVSAPPDEIYGELAGSPSGSVATIGFDSPYYSGVDGETLSVGDGWEASGANGNVSFRVEEISAYAGLECANFVVRTNGSVFWESCVTPESPLPGYMAFYEEEGDEEPAFEMVLVEYRAGD
ncbi:hypothetical protein [Haloferax marisrubri]|uniref:Lipoprotein n=1 Tax=Haloferax marisrubri TaxID=1544719 RepID=A0A2P4NS90_9EURY|nr:hypothetical protein [Haloferax marisrubri]POG56027.1 hypothetical protein AUR65_011090 [Haloferax marisrubri]